MIRKPNSGRNVYMNNRPANQHGKRTFDKGTKTEHNIYIGSQRSDFAENEDFLKILIFTLILMLTLAFVLFFAFGSKKDPSLPVINTGVQDPSTADNDDSKNDDPKTDTHPYATVPKREKYVASDTHGTKEWISDLNSGYAVLVDLSDMSVIAGKYADEIIYPASMTKIMTVVVACDLITDLNDKYVIKSEVLSKVPYGASTAYLSTYIGKEATVEDLLYGISYRSGADSVICLLDHLGISVKDFTALMNKKADEIGLKQTHFGGVIGMDTENNTTTCREMAAILAYALDNPLCKRLFGGEEYRPSFANDVIYYHSTIVNTLSGEFSVNNGIVVSGYKMIAAKSGYETKAEHCLASCSENISNGKQYILVTAHAHQSKANPIKDYITVFKQYHP